jgi:hypothetical protein
MVNTPYLNCVCGHVPARSRSIPETHPSAVIGSKRHRYKDSHALPAALCPLGTASQRAVWTHVAGSGPICARISRSSPGSPAVMQPSAPALVGLPRHARGGRARREAAGGMSSDEATPSTSSSLPPRRPPATPRRRACRGQLVLAPAPEAPPRAHTLVSQLTPAGPELPPLQPQRLEPCPRAPALRPRAVRLCPQRIHLAHALPAFSRVMAYKRSSQSSRRKLSPTERIYWLFLMCHEHVTGALV